MNPLVSAIVTFHNQAPFVAPTLDSVLAQTHPRMEVIDLVGPYLVGLLLPAPLVTAALRLLRVRPSSRPRLNPGA